MLAQRRRRWTNFKPKLNQRLADQSETSQDWGIHVCHTCCQLTDLQIDCTLPDMKEGQNN